MEAPDTFRYTKIPLNNGSGEIPVAGFGTLIRDPVATKQATRTALEVGFRHFDCAEVYRNEEAVGDAMQWAFRAGTIRREDVFVTTKLWNTNHCPERVKPAFHASRRELQIDYVDCYLIHTPFDFQPGDEEDPRDERGHVIYDSGVTLIDTWRALECLVDEGHCKSIGLSNVTLDQLRRIVVAARIKPRGASAPARRHAAATLSERLRRRWTEPARDKLGEELTGPTAPLDLSFRIGDAFALLL
jgi:diketogulonate reductase-like aldo/keto reductase